MARMAELIAELLEAPADWREPLPVLVDCPGIDRVLDRAERLAVLELEDPALRRALRNLVVRQGTTQLLCLSAGRHRWRDGRSLDPFDVLGPPGPFTFLALFRLGFRCQLRDRVSSLIRQVPRLNRDELLDRILASSRRGREPHQELIPPVDPPRSLLVRFWRWVTGQGNRPSTAESERRAFLTWVTPLIALWDWSGHWLQHGYFHEPSQGILDPDALLPPPEPPQRPPGVQLRQWLTGWRTIGAGPAQGGRSVPATPSAPRSSVLGRPTPVSMPVPCQYADLVALGSFLMRSPTCDWSGWEDILARHPLLGLFDTSSQRRVGALTERLRRPPAQAAGATFSEEARALLQGRHPDPSASPKGLQADYGILSGLARVLGCQAARWVVQARRQSLDPQAVDETIHRLQPFLGPGLYQGTYANGSAVFRMDVLASMFHQLQFHLGPGPSEPGTGGPTLLQALRAAGLPQLANLWEDLTMIFFHYHRAGLGIEAPFTGLDLAFAAFLDKIPAECLADVRPE
jgi:hypothetical protein